MATDLEREEAVEWLAKDHGWPGILLRIATPQPDGSVLITCKRVPLDRDLQDAMDWAAREFFDPTRPATRPFGEPISTVRRR